MGDFTLFLPRNWKWISQDHYYGTKNERQLIDVSRSVLTSHETENIGRYAFFLFYIIAAVILIETSGNVSYFNSI